MSIAVIVGENSGVKAGLGGESVGKFDFSRVHRNGSTTQSHVAQVPADTTFGLSVSIPNMPLVTLPRILHSIVLPGMLLWLSGCITSKKFDQVVAESYHNALPKPAEATRSSILIRTPTPPDYSYISRTERETDQFLYLLFYLKHVQRIRCRLNPAIGMGHFARMADSLAATELAPKLRGRRLELTVEQAPAEFSLLMKVQTVWLFMSFSWGQTYLAPEARDLVVSYQVGEGAEARSGRITVRNPDADLPMRRPDTWRTLTTRYVAAYNSNYLTMTRELLSQLAAQL